MRRQAGAPLIRLFRALASAYRWCAVLSNSTAVACPSKRRDRSPCQRSAHAAAAFPKSPLHTAANSASQRITGVFSDLSLSVLVSKSTISFALGRKVMPTTFFAVHSAQLPCWLGSSRCSWRPSGKPEWGVRERIDPPLPRQCSRRSETGTSAAQVYWENHSNNFNAVDIPTMPVAVIVFPGEIHRAPLTWADRCYHNLIYFNEADNGGHFAAWEQPQLFTTEVRAAFRSLR